MCRPLAIWTTGGEGGWAGGGEEKKSEEGGCKGRVERNEEEAETSANTLTNITSL